MPEPFKGTIFLLALVTAASMMRSKKLPAASCDGARLRLRLRVFTTFRLRARAQTGRYDWAIWPNAVGFGGSMIWFALRRRRPVRTCIRKRVGRTLVSQGCHRAAYVVGFFVMLVILGWHPDAPHYVEAHCIARSILSIHSSSAH